MIALDYEIEADKNGIIDGRTLAKELIRDAYKLLLPYARECPGCCDGLFLVIGNETIDEIQKEKDDLGRIKGIILTNKEGLNEKEIGEAQLKHLSAQEESSRELLIRAREKWDWEPKREREIIH